MYRLRTAFFTIASWNYAHLARGMAKSVKAHHPGADIFLYLADREHPDLGASDIPEFTHLVPFEHMGFPDGRAMAFRYVPLEFTTALKPTGFLDLIARGYDRIVYLDADIRLFAPLAEVLAALDAGASSVLTPHALRPGAGGEATDLSFMRAGIYNLGFFAVASTPEAVSGLRWWQQRLRTGCLIRQDQGIFVDQKYLDLWPAYAPTAHILRHPGYNVAYWNLDSRQLARTGSGVTVDGAPLVFFHFSGYRPDLPDRVSLHRPDIGMDDYPALRPLFDAYRAELDELGREHFAPIPYGYGTFTDGTAVSPMMRGSFREELEPFASDPFLGLDDELNAPAAVDPNPNGVVTRLGHATWRQRADLRRAFDLRSARAQIDYARWFVANSALGSRFTAPVAERLAGVAPAKPRPRPRRKTSNTRPSGMRALLPPALLGPARRLRRLLAGSPPKRVTAHEPLKAPQPVNVEVTPGVTLIGYAFAELGLGESLRGIARSAMAAGIPLSVINRGDASGARQGDRSIAPLVTGVLDRSVNLFCVNADRLDAAVTDLGPAGLAGRYNIAFPYWELAVIPDGWVPTLERVDEIWAGSRFIADTFAARLDRPVTLMPPAVTLPPGIRSDRARYGIPRDSLAFMFAFDTASYGARKNPGAVLEAFRRAFGGSRREDVSLVVKVHGSGTAGAAWLSLIRSFAATDPRIILVEGTLTRIDTVSLLDSMDVFVSLHRSEGFGLWLAEAMLLGKAVIATDYSGSTDFVTPQTGFPVPYRLIDVQPGEYAHYVPGQQWADPDIDAAAATMRQLYEDRTLIATRAAAGRALIETRHSHAAMGQRLKDRLAAIESGRGA